MRLKNAFCSLVLISIVLQVHSQNIKWTKKADLPIPISKSKAAVVNGKIYVMGGTTPNFKGFCNANYEYNPESDTWTKKKDMPTGRTNYAIAAVENKIYVIGGDPFQNKVEVYDPKTDSWDSLSVMPSQRQHISCATIEKKIYVIGGFENICCPPYPQRCNWETCAKISDRNQVYSVSTDKWIDLAPMPTPRHGLDMMSVNGKIYVIGGMGSASSIWETIGTIEIYNPIENKWIEKNDMTTPRDGYGYSVQDGLIFLFGGWIAENQQTTNTIVYDTKNDTWSNATNLPIKTGAFAYATLGNKIYIFGGDKEDYSGILSSTYVGEITK
jgi:N-acetylneuraminic acid mutarotase